MAERRKQLPGIAKKPQGFTSMQLLWEFRKLRKAQRALSNWKSLVDAFLLENLDKQTVYEEEVNEEEMEQEEVEQEEVDEDEVEDEEVEEQEEEVEEEELEEVEVEEEDMEEEDMEEEDMEEEDVEEEEDPMFPNVATQTDSLCRFPSVQQLWQKHQMYLNDDWNINVNMIITLMLLITMICLLLISLQYGLFRKMFVKKKKTWYSGFSKVLQTFFKR